MMSTPRTAGLLALAAVEIALGWEYHARGAVWELLVLSLVGLGLGLAFAALLALAGRRSTPLVWAPLGQLLAIMPDLVFVLGRQPEQHWMDVFLGHVSIRLVAQPLLVALGVFLLGGWAWLAARLRRAVVAVILVMATVGLWAGALATHAPLPRHLSQFTNVESAG